MHSMVTAKQYARHQGQFPNMGGVIYEIWHSSSSLIGSRHSSSESVPNSPSDKPYLFLAFSFPLSGIPMKDAKDRYLSRQAICSRHMATWPHGHMAGDCIARICTGTWKCDWRFAKFKSRPWRQASCYCCVSGPGRIMLVISRDDANGNVRKPVS